jgi:hypothetical protein
MPTIPEPVIAQPVDVSNTLAKIASMKHMDMSNKNLQSEIETRNANSEAQNALRVIQEREAKEKLATTQLENATKSLNYIKGLPTIHQKAALDDFLQSDQGKPLSDKINSNMFMSVDKDGKAFWDDKAFNVAASVGAEAMKMVNSHGTGEQVKQTVQNPDFDPTKPESPKNMRWAEQLVTNLGFGKFEPVAGTKPIPMYTSAQLADKNERHQKVVESTQRKAAENKQSGLVPVEEEDADGNITVVYRKKADAEGEKVGKVQKPLTGLAKVLDDKRKAKEAKAKADKEKGGEYKTAEDVKTAYTSGKLTKEAAAKILQTNFGMK